MIKYVNYYVYWTMRNLIPAPKLSKLARHHETSWQKHVQVTWHSTRLRFVALLIIILWSANWLLSITTARCACNTTSTWSSAHETSWQRLHLAVWRDNWQPPGTQVLPLQCLTGLNHTLFLYTENHEILSRNKKKFLLGYNGNYCSFPSVNSRPGLN